MTRNQVIRQLRTILEEEWDQLDEVVHDIAIDSYDAPKAITEAWSTSGEGDSEKFLQVLLQLKELSIIPWLATADNLSGSLCISALSDVVSAYQALQETVVTELRIMLQSKNPVPIPQLEMPIAEEEKELPSRECENAYYLLRRILKTDESEWVSELTRRALLRMEEKESDQKIIDYVRTGQWERLVNKAVLLNDPLHTEQGGSPK